MTESWRLVFLGSADFSLPALKALLAGPDKVELVVAPPPARSGRGRALADSPVALLAREAGLPLLETSSVRGSEALAAIRRIRPDLLVAAAYGGFLPRELLDLGLYPPLNIHPSLLPRHRGAAPVNWTLIAGDRQAGVSIIFLEEEMDAGPVLRQTALDLNGAEKAGELYARLAEIGAADLMLVIEELKAGRGRPRRQDPGRATVNPLLRKADGAVDWTRPAPLVAAHINGVDPWPGAQARLEGRLVKLFGARAADLEEAAAPGQVLGLSRDGRLLVAAGQGTVLIEELQLEGKKRQSAQEFVRGYQPGQFTVGP